MKSQIIFLIFLFAASAFPLFGYPTDDVAGYLAECAKIKNDNERLKCFDNLSRQTFPRSSVKDTAGPASTETADYEKRAEEVIAKAKPIHESSGTSVMSKRWELDAESRRNAP